MAALKLFENDSLDLNKNVNYYLKKWQIPENKFTKTKKITLEKLLTHTAGMTVHGFPGYKQTDDFPEIIDVLNGKGNTPKIVVDTIPGSIWRYSGGGYTVMEKVIEDVSGLSFDEYMSKNILLPIGMKNSTYQQPITKVWQNNISAAYDGNGKLIKGLWNNYPEQAAAGLWTTASDLALYCIEIQDIIQGKKDGILTAYEAMNLNLDHTELVVLSACETGVGEIKSGEGVYGLQRSFIVAGAQNVIMTFFKVNDEVTQELMSDFYTQWLATGDKRAAFQSAKLKIKEKYQKPVYWGSFVLIGM